ncbi:MAG: mechanosensitive ion channel family protein, partial [Cyclobacteriaceae bacterium]|nr:mechanosensitive ion channel family protein [Cyclobacteriaceae bacterium]
MKYLEDDNYHPDISAKVFNPKQVKKEDAEDKAIALLQIYKGAGISFSFEDIPTIPDYRDSLTLNQIYVISTKYPQIYLEKVGAFWFYSKETVQNIDEIHAQVYPYGAEKLLELLPKFGTSKYFGLRLWQLIGILIIIVISLVIHKVFTLIIEKII